MSTSCSGALLARSGTALLAISQGERAAFRAQLSQHCRLAFLRCSLWLHRFAAGHHACAPCLSIVNARSSGVVHGFNPWPRPVRSPASLFDCTRPAQNRVRLASSRRCSAGSGEQLAGFDGVGNVWMRLLQRVAVASSFLRALVHHHAHSSCSDSSPPPCVSGHLWVTNADVLAPASQLMAQVGPRGYQ